MNEKKTLYITFHLIIYSINIQATPIIGQKRLQRRNTSSTSFKQNSLSDFPSNPETGLVSTANYTETRNIMNGNESLLLSSSSMSTLNKNMSLNSSNNNSNNTASSPSSTLPSSACKVNVPKSPKPQRTLAIFECVIIGLK